MTSDDVPPVRPAGPGRAGRPARRSPRTPLWAKVSVVVGALIAVVSGAVVVVPRVLAGWATAEIPREDLIPSEIRGKNIEGPINILLLGLDERTSNNLPAHADSIILVHVSADHRHAFMVSIPRDTEVTIPPFPASQYPGGRTKITDAFAYGSAKNGRRDDSVAGRQRGTGLTSLTLNALVPGGLTINAVVIINFEGFKKILNALGGLTMCVDEETRSIHYDKNNKYHTAQLDYADRKVYRKACYHLEGWEVLDFSRQRHFDVGAEYVRQRHQQQVLMAIFTNLMSTGTLTDVGKVTALQRVAGDLLTVDLGEAAVLDWIWTLKGIKPADVVLIKTNAGRVNPIGNNNEALTPDSMRLLKAVHDDTVDQFLTKHPDWVVKTSGT